MYHFPKLPVQYRYVFASQHQRNRVSLSIPLESSFQYTQVVGGVYFIVHYKSIVSTLANRITVTHKPIVLAPPTVTLDDSSLLRNGQSGTRKNEWN